MPKKSKHPFDKYFRCYGHYPQLKLDNGCQRLTVEFTPGYVRIKTSSPYSGEVYITRSAWFRLLKRAIPLSRHWTSHPDFDVPQRVHEAHLSEMSHLDALRAEKRTRKIDVPDPQAQHQRWLRAQARAQRKASD